MSGTIAEDGTLDGGAGGMERDIREAVLAAYGRIGREGSRPPEGLGFPTGRELAQRLGYPQDILSQLPPEAFDSFVGAYPLPSLALERTLEKGWVLDCGAGAGVDSLWLALRGRPVVALDGSREMLARLVDSLHRLREGHAPVAPLRSWLPNIPVRSAFASDALLNGVANIVPEKSNLLAELFRALLPGGRLFVADVLLLGEREESLAADPDAWAFCVAGALSPEEWRSHLLEAGFSNVEVTIIEEFPPLGRGLIRGEKP